MKLKYKRILTMVIISILSFFVSYKIIDMLLYDYMFVVDMQEDGNYKLVNSYENGVSFELEKEDEYFIANIPEQITGYSINFKIKLNEAEKRIEQVIYNDEELDSNNIIKLTDISSYDMSYYNMPVFMVNRNPAKKILATIGMFILMTTIIYIILLKQHDGRKVYENLIYSKKSYSLLKKRDYIVLVVLFLITFFITVGCDAKVIANVGNLFSEDIDIYQLQVNSKVITGREYAEFPYNPMMLCIWGGILNIFRPVTKILPVIWNYPYWEVGILKLFNLIFIVLTINAVLSFLLDKKIIEEKRAKWILYLGIFNPVTFYVAMLFVQLDALTLYLITTGTLLLDKLNKNNFSGILLLSIGLMLKMQILFLIPITIIAILYIIFYCCEDKVIDKIIRAIKCVMIFLFFAISTFGILYVLKTPFYYLETNLAQSERLWYTVVQYTGYTSLYVTLGALVVAMILFVLNIHSRISKSNIIMSSLIYYAVIIFLFSFSILPTPSVYIVTLGGTLILVALENDKLKNVLLLLTSFLIILCPMFSDYGDISKVIKKPDEKGIITSYIEQMEDTEEKKVNSITFSISAVSMLTYAIYMGKQSLKLLKKREEQENA